MPSSGPAPNVIYGDRREDIVDETLEDPS